MKTASRRRILLLVLIVLFIAGFLLSLMAGPAHTSARDFLDLLTGRSTANALIFIDLRLSRAVLAFFVGAALSLSGAILQGFFRNSMADPFVIGASSGASFGAVLSLVLGIDISVFGFSGQSAFAFAAGMGLVSFVYLLARKSDNLRVETLLLTGIAAGAMASAMTSFLLFTRADSFEQAVFWFLGSFALADWRQVGLLAPYVVVALVVALAFAKDMNLLVMGEETARSLGCRVERVRKIFLVLATLLAALSVAVSGIIGFVGLIVPHWIRILIGPDHRSLFLHSALAGGVFLVFCDLIARTVVFPVELPIGVITAVVGAPFFIYLLNRKS